MIWRGGLGESRCDGVGLQMFIEKSDDGGFEIHLRGIEVKGVESAIDEDEFVLAASGFEFFCESDALAGFYDVIRRAVDDEKGGV